MDIDNASATLKSLQISHSQGLDQRCLEFFLAQCPGKALEQV